MKHPRQCFSPKEQIPSAGPLAGSPLGVPSTLLVVASEPIIAGSALAFRKYFQLAIKESCRWRLPNPTEFCFPKVYWEEILWGSEEPGFCHHFLVSSILVSVLGLWSPPIWTSNMWDLAHHTQ